MTADYRASWPAYTSHMIVPNSLIPETSWSMCVLIALKSPKWVTKDPISAQ